MDKSDERYGCYVAILEEELVCAMGCTEPIAIAYAAARARELLGARPDRLAVSACGSIIKNAKSVVVPHTGGLKGIEAAAAAGVVAGRPECELEVIAEVGEDDVEAIVAYLAETPIEVECAPGCADFDIVVRAFAEGADAPHHEVLVHIADYHTNVVREERDGAVVFDAPTAAAAGEADGLRGPFAAHHGRHLGLRHDVRPGRRAPSGRPAGGLQRPDSRRGAFGRLGRQHRPRDAGRLRRRREGARLRTRRGGVRRAHERLRASGCHQFRQRQPGHHRVGAVGGLRHASWDAADDQLRRALVLSNLVAIHQRAGIGRLSAFCGAVCAGAAAGAGIAYLDGGGYEDAVHAVVNALSIVAGMVCDGAKASCAAKIAFSVNAGILGYVMYRDGQQFYGGDGIVKKGVENTIDSVAQLGREGMRATNEEIIKIMLGS